MSNLQSVESKAKKFACEKHRNQKRQDGITPFVNHLEGVVNRLKNLGVTDSEIVVTKSAIIIFCFYLFVLIYLLPNLYRLNHPKHPT